MRMRIAIVVLAACGAAPVPLPPPAATPPAPVETFCPQAYDLGWWAHEVFPACQAPPFEMAFVTLCGGKACPVPCSGSWALIGESVSSQVVKRGSVAFRFDARGRYLNGDGEGGRSDGDCTYDASGRLAMCRDQRVERDRGGRVTAVTIGGKTTTVVYDARGRAIAEGAQTLEYDAAGLLARVGNVVLEREGGRVVRERFVEPGATGLAELRYDEGGRVVAETLHIDPTSEDPDPMILEVSVTYDGDRVMTIKRLANGHGRSHGYWYDCTP